MMKVINCEMQRANAWALDAIGQMGYSITPIRLTGIDDFVEKPQTVLSIVTPEDNANGRVYLRLDRFNEGTRYFDLTNYQEIKREHADFTKRLQKNIVKAYNFYHRKCYDEQEQKLSSKAALRAI